ncbi:centrosomal protein of 78 kDa [Clonorchis sinensis]|uniref:Centrosomal protein of 78 kDa n=1 Tax=Clonorchis sinensis TaxID=79923 RepID=G7YP47_CLOSI|nr:centrosomal protein of 78 kDa [Clonorchis sinensis]
MNFIIPISLCDWGPVIQSIEINRTLNHIGFRSCHASRSECPVTKPRRPAPAWLSNSKILRSICQAVASSLQITTALVFLELKNIPLIQADVNCLCKGIANNRTLRHLSFSGCPIGDAGIAEICRALRHAPDLATVNISGCQITQIGAAHIAELIKHQTIKRHTAAWQDSLRYRYPALDQLGGLRRITMNDNPRLGDSGSIRIAESLFDDLWVKAVDLQACNLSDRSAMTWLRVLTGTPSTLLFGKPETSQLPEECRGNHSLAVVDLRRNPNISREILRAVTERALLNSEGKQTEFNWLKTCIPGSPEDSRYGITAFKWPGMTGFRERRRKLRTCLKTTPASKPATNTSAIRRPSSAQPQRERSNVTVKRYRSRSAHSTTSPFAPHHRPNEGRRTSSSTPLSNSRRISARAVWKPPGVVHDKHSVHSQISRAIIKRIYTFPNLKPAGILNSLHAQPKSRMSCRPNKSPSTVPLSTPHVERLTPTSHSSGRRPRSGNNAPSIQHSFQQNHHRREQGRLGSSQKNFGALHGPHSLHCQLRQLMGRVTQLEEQLNKESSRPPAPVLTKQTLDAGDSVSPRTPVNGEIMGRLNELVRYVQPILGTLQSNPISGQPLSSDMNLDQLRRHLQQLCVLVKRFNAGTEESKTSSQPESYEFDVSHNERTRHYHLVHQKIQTKPNVSNSLNDVSVEPSHNSATRVLGTADLYLPRMNDPEDNSMFRTSLNVAKVDSLSSMDTSVEKEIPSDAPNQGNKPTSEAQLIIEKDENCPETQGNNNNHFVCSVKETQCDPVRHQDTLASTLERSWKKRIMKEQYRKDSITGARSPEDLIRLQSEADRIFAELKAETLKADKSIPEGDTRSLSGYVHRDPGEVREGNNFTDNDSKQDSAEVERDRRLNIKKEYEKGEDDFGETITDDEESIQLWSKAQSVLSKVGSTKAATPNFGSNKSGCSGRSYEPKNLAIDNTEDSDLSLNSTNDLNDLICEYSELDEDELTFVDLTNDEYNLSSSRLSGQVPSIGKSSGTTPLFVK